MSSRNQGEWPRYVIVVPLILVILVSFRFLLPSVKESLPACFFYKLTGYHCPGCGGTRSAAALVYFDIAEAFRQHAWFTVSVILGLPLVLWMAVKEKWPIIPGPRYHDRWLWVGLISLILFGVMRNIGALNWMAPS